MKTSIFVIAFALVGSLAAAEKTDTRLAAAKSAHIIAVDELGDDRAVAQCVVDHIAQTTPIAVVAAAEPADLELRIGVTKKAATINVYLPDGKTRLWSGDNELKAGFGLVKVRMDACTLADNLIVKLRDAMRKARDGK